MQLDETRMDHLFHDFEQERELLVRHSHSAIKSVRLAKSAAFRMASRYIAMQKTDRQWLLNMIKSSYPGESDPIDKWIEQSFAPLMLLLPGENPFELIKAVKDGMPLNKYLSQTPALFLAGKRSRDLEKKASQVQSEVPVPAEPADDLSTEESIKQWKLRAKALELRATALQEQVRELTSLRASDQRRIALLESSVSKLNKLLTKGEAAPTPQQ
jgi:hypothetical protein